MVKIVTGKINDYKSTRLYQHYLKHQIGDGFISIKYMSGHQVHHYNARRLSTGKEHEFLVHEQFYDQKDESAYQIGPYHVLKEAMNMIDTAVKEMVALNISPIYLDEVGKLELIDKGFASLIHLILENQISLVMVVREDLVSRVVEKFQIKEFEVIGE